MWLAAGWALHPLWDAVLHYFGPGSSFAPVSYTIPCIRFEMLVAVYIAIIYGSGVLGGLRAALQESACFLAALSPTAVGCEATRASETSTTRQASERRGCRRRSRLRFVVKHKEEGGVGSRTFGD
jgi:hypothetical protein